MLTPDDNGKVTIERFSREHEMLAELYDYAAMNGATDDQLRELNDLLNGTEYDVDIAYEVAYGVVFNVPRLRDEVDDRDMTAVEYIEHIYSSSASN